MPIYGVVGIGLAGTLVTLIHAMTQGRKIPARRVPWWIAVIVLGLDSAFHVAMSVGAVIQGGWESTWIVLGTLAITGVFATAIIRPRIAGWWLIVTAIVLPIVLVAASAIWTSSSEESVPIEVLLGLYSTRMLVIGGLLVWCAIPREKGSRMSDQREGTSPELSRVAGTTDPGRSSSAR